MKKQKGQIVLLLILVMTVALAIGISVIQRSLSDISTSSKVEESSRAFSAAEAGIETALNTPPFPTTLPLFSLSNNSQAQAVDSGLLPVQAAVGSQQDPLEYPPLTKEDRVQVWLANPFSTTNPPAEFYDPPLVEDRTLEVYWGNSDTDQAALELTLVYHDGSQYKSRKWYLDNAEAQDGSGTRRIEVNNFDPVDCTVTVLPSNIAYQCKKTLGDGNGRDNGSLPTGLMLLRARLLYNSSRQPFAVWATGTCGLSCSLPGQARILDSTGTAGGTQRKVRVIQEYKVVPPYFDYAIFSADEISKP